jgi:ABC-type nitrate/sulfonate/bicarbonate transport system substrate-binding protein
MMHRATPGESPPASTARLRVNVFLVASNLPLLVGLEKGIFAHYRLEIDVQYTPNSDQQRDGLAAGKFEIAHSGIDNAVAMVDQAKEDVAVVMGGDAGMNEFMVRAEIMSFADIRGKVLAVDAPTTSYALLAKTILRNNGLLEGRDYTVQAVGGTQPRAAAMASTPELAAGMVSPPFSFTTRSQGLKSLGRVHDLVGPYQATSAFVLRKWAQANTAVLERYLAAYITATRYAMDPANRAEMIELLADRFRLEAAIAELTYDALLTPGFGLAADARLDMAGFRNVLAIRAEIGGKDDTVPAPDKYLDFSYYERAAATLP